VDRCHIHDDTLIPVFSLAARFFVVFVLGCQSRHQAFPLSRRTRRLDRAAGLCRMRGGVDLLQGADGDLGVNLRGPDVLVAEDGLDVPDASRESKQPRESPSLSKT
jgi:hypothetical protein